MRDYEDIKRDLVERESVLKDAETGAAVDVDVDALRIETAHLRRDLYEHPQHPAVTEGQEDNDDAGTYPQRTM